MILEIETKTVSVEAGVLQALLKVKTDGGVLPVNVAFELRKHPELDALIPVIDEAVRAVAARTLGLTPAAPAAA